MRRHVERWGWGSGDEGDEVDGNMGRGGGYDIVYEVRGKMKGGGGGGGGAEIGDAAAGLEFMNVLH